MKKIFTLIAAVVSAMSVGAKDFTDNLHLTVMGNDLNSESTITVDKVEGSDDTYDITLNDFSFDTFPLGDIKIEGVKGETAPDGMVSFEETTTSVTVSLGNASVTINEGSRMKGDKLYLDMTIVALDAINVTAVFGDDNFPKAYTDDLTVTFMGDTSAPQPTTIFVETQADGKYTLSLKNFKFGTMGVGNVVLTDVEGTDNGGVVNLSAEQTIKITEGQMLDDMDLERERGITIKSHAIQMEYEYEGEKYILNLIDTPGHVDFSYEVSRSIAACEGALLVVDATQGVQAQTISNLYMAIDHDLEIIPVINKIDMPSAMPDEVEDEIIDLIGCDRTDIIRASGKTGEGVDDILKAVVTRVPHPTGDPDAPLQALIFDSVFNSFRGIIAYFKIENGSIRKGDKADFTVFTVTKGHYVFMDANKNVLEGTESIEVELALKEGEIVMKRELKPLELKVIDELKSRDEWTPADFEKYGDDLRDVLILMRDRNVFFEEGNLLAFTNHVMTLFRRLETGEKVDALDESILEEINYKAMEVAKELVSRYASKYGEADMTELVLLAIHIQTAQEQFEESLKH